MNAMNKKRGLAGMVAVLFLGLAACLLSACNDEVLSLIHISEPTRRS